MELLKDPGNTRVCKGLPLPPHRPLRQELLFQKNGINLGLLKDFLRKEGRIAF
jgi:serine/threonine-protein phosphatase 2B catalytic subunit